MLPAHARRSRRLEEGRHMASRVRAVLLGLGVLALSATAHAQTIASSEVVVTAPRQETVAREKQFSAPNIVNIQAGETLAKYPDFNAAESLGRIPGISISTDTGEGRFVNIRGIDGNLAGATFGGVPLLNTYPGGTYFGGGGRAVEYDTIPTGSIDGLIVYKTTLPDHEAEGLGGSIELTPRTASNLTAPMLEATVGYGYEPEHDHPGPLNGEIVVGGRFGFDGSHFSVGGAEPVRMGFFSNPEPFALVLTASWREDHRGFDDIEEDYNDTTVDRSYADIQFRRYDYHRRRFGYGGEFDFQPNDEHAWYVRANVAGYTESVLKNRLTYSANPDVTVDPANPSGFAGTASMDLASTDEEETHRNQVYVIGGSDHFGDSGVVLDYRASYSRATYHQSKNFGADFQGPTAIPWAYDNSKNNGNFPKIVVDTSILNDPTQYSPITAVGNSTEEDKDREYAYAANLLVPLHIFNDKDSIKVGGEVRLRYKTSYPFSDQYNLNSPLSLADASTAAVTNFYYYYTNGPYINHAVVRNTALASPLDPSSGLSISSVFTAREDIYAGYAEYQAQIGKFGIMAGVRVEATRAQYGAYSDDNAAQTLAFVLRDQNYTNAFPTVQLRYQLNPDMLVRATWSTGIGRPGFLQNSATTSSNHDPAQPVITQGNPNLLPTTGNVFDLDYEWYLPHGGILQLGAFYDIFDNYIVDQVQHKLYTGTEADFIGKIVEYDTFGNRGGAYARGIEAAYHQQFTFLPGFWKGFGIEANATLVDSRILEYDAATSGTGQNVHNRLPGTSRLTWNLAGFYEDHGFQVRIAAEYVSKELFSLSGIGGTPAQDSIQDKRLTLDFTSSYNVTKNAAIYFNVKNITDEPLRFYVNNSSFPIQREFYQQTFEAGIRIRF
jgi:TonB-dependent receptor